MKRHVCPYCRVEYPTPSILARHKERCPARRRVATVLPTPEAFEERKRAFLTAKGRRTEMSIQAENDAAEIKRYCQSAGLKLDTFDGDNGRYVATIYPPAVALPLIALESAIRRSGGGGRWRADRATNPTTGVLERILFHRKTRA